MKAEDIIGAPDADIIQTAKTLLEWAESGLLSGVVIGFTMRDGSSGEVFTIQEEDKPAQHLKLLALFGVVDALRSDYFASRHGKYEDHDE